MKRRKLNIMYPVHKVTFWMNKIIVRVCGWPCSTTWKWKFTPISLDFSFINLQIQLSSLTFFFIYLLLFFIIIIWLLISWSRMKMIFPSFFKFVYLSSNSNFIWLNWFLLLQTELNFRAKFKNFILYLNFFQFS